MGSLVDIFGVLVLVFHVGQCQLPLGTIIPAMQAGSQVMNLLPASARECVNKITTKAVSDSLVSKLASSAGSILGNNAPTITRDPGNFQCRNGVPYYRETAHVKASIASIPIDLPINTESDLSPCFKSGIPNPCGLFGGAGQGLINSFTGGDKTTPAPTIGGVSLGGLFGGNKGGSGTSGSSGFSGNGNGGSSSNGGGNNGGGGSSGGLSGILSSFKGSSSGSGSSSTGRGTNQGPDGNGSSGSSGGGLFSGGSRGSSSSSTSFGTSNQGGSVQTGSSSGSSSSSSGLSEILSSLKGSSSTSDGNNSNGSNGSNGSGGNLGRLQGRGNK